MRAGANAYNDNDATDRAVLFWLRQLDHKLDEPTLDSPCLRTVYRRFPSPSGQLWLERVLDAFKNRRAVT